MEAPKLDVESCLNLAQIPFISIPYDAKNLESLIEKNIHDCFGIIISGSRGAGPEDDAMPPVSQSILNSDLPKLGVCYGHEVLGQFLGSKVVLCSPPAGEQSEVEAQLFDSVLFEGLDLNEKYMVTMAHDYMLDSLPNGSKLIARTQLTPIGGFENLDRKIFGLQFHPEKDWMGDIVFKNFYKFCEESEGSTVKNPSTEQ
jgi:GMP synthase (glutamine-hydrolysing)